MKTTISKLYKDDQISVWGEVSDNHKTYLEVDSKSARYATGKFSNVVALKVACGYKPEINKWWLALA